MNIFKIIKELYTGKSNLIAQLGIFSLIGIMIISANQVVSAFTGNTLYSVFAAPSESEVIIFALTGIMLFIYFSGYLFKFAHESFDSSETELASISMDCFPIFLKTFPVMFIWSVYVGLALLLGYLLFTINRLEFFAYIILILILLPFVNMVFIIFAKDFSYSKLIFNPAIIVKLMSKTFVPAALFLIQYLFAGFVFSIIFGVIFSFISYINSREQQIFCILLVLSISSYIQMILNLVYYKGLAEILKKYYLK